MRLLWPERCRNDVKIACYVNKISPPLWLRLLRYTSYRFVNAMRASIVINQDNDWKLGDRCLEPTSLYTSQVTPYESRTYKGSSGGIAPSLLHADTPEALAARGSGRCA